MTSNTLKEEITNAIRGIKALTIQDAKVLTTQELIEAWSRLDYISDLKYRWYKRTGEFKENPTLAKSLDAILDELDARYPDALADYLSNGGNLPEFFTGLA